MAVASRKKCINGQCIVKAFICTQVIHVKSVLTSLWLHDENEQTLNVECFLYTEYNIIECYYI